jgi:hypothetical protein
MEVVGSDRGSDYIDAMVERRQQETREREREKKKIKRGKEPDVE